MAGVTSEGLVIKRLPEIINSMRVNAAEVFGDLVDPGDTVDTSDSSTIGRIIGLVSNELYDLWEAAQGVYWAYDPNSAVGVALDNLVMLAGISRRSEEPTTADIYVEGNSGGVVVAGSQVRSSLTGNTYRTSNDLELSPENCIGIGISITTPVTSGDYVITYQPSHSATSFTITVPRVVGESQSQALDRIADNIESNHPLLRTYFRDNRLFMVGTLEYQLFNFTVSTPININKVVSTTVVVGTVPGPVEEPTDALSIIATPSLSWDYVWNPFPASVGSFRETDEELRIRFRDTKFQRSTNIIESLYSSLYELDGVEEVYIIENDTDVVDEYGNPPHSFLVLVEGGLNSSIAYAIWRNRPVGIKSNGNITVNILDAFGFIRDIQFSRPEYVPIYIQISLTKDPSFPPGGEDQIRDALVEHINTYGIGQDVVYSRLYTPINSIPGHQVDSLEIGSDPLDLQASNIDIDYNEKPILTKENISFV